MAAIERLGPDQPAAPHKRRARRSKGKIVELESRSPLLHPKAADALVLASKPLDEGNTAEPAKAAVVAEVLADGTVRPTGQIPNGEWRRFSNGTISGKSWTLWWTRRNWGKAPA
jgi:hypothetical protein